MKSPERIALAALAPQPWKNGAGLTRELAVEPHGASMSDFAWRISLAEVDRDAPFSAFPGIDRHITLLRGAGMRLASVGNGAEMRRDESPVASHRSPDSAINATIDHALDRALEPFAFSGDVALQATLFAGPCADFNVMTRRGAWRADLTVHRRTFEAAAADAILLLCTTGAWQIESGATDHDAVWALAADQALLWRHPAGELWAAPLENQHDSTLICVRLCHDHRP